VAWPGRRGPLPAFRFVTGDRGGVFRAKRDEKLVQPRSRECRVVRARVLACLVVPAVLDDYTGWAAFRAAIEGRSAIRFRPAAKMPSHNS
jgi:hypothetical protein